MSPTYTNNNTTWREKQESEARRKALPQRLPRLTRKNSLIVKVRCAPTFKSAIKATATKVKNGSVNRLVRKAFRSRRCHFPNLPSPDPGEKATARLTLRLTAEEWQAFKDYAAAWRMPLWRALWLLVARPYTVADRPRALSHTRGAQHGAQFSNSRRNFCVKASSGYVSSLSHTGSKKERNKKKEYIHVCSLTAEEPKPINGLAEKLHNYYGVRLSVANDLVVRYDREEIEAAMELRERRNGAIYNPAGFIVYLLREGYAQRWAEVKRARQDPEFLASQVKQAVEAEGFPITVTINNCIPFAEFPNARLALPLDPVRAISLLNRIFGKERAEADEFDETEETNEPPSSHQFGHAKVNDTAPPSIAEQNNPSVLVNNDEAVTEPIPNAKPGASDGEITPVSVTGFAPPEPIQNTEIEEPEFEDNERCQKCGRHAGEVPLYEDKPLCIECAGFKRACEDCGGDFELSYRERFDTLLCRRCYLKRLARSAGMNDYEPPPRFPWIVFPEKNEEEQSQPSSEAQEGENQRARKTPLDWLKTLFRGR